MKFYSPSTHGFYDSVVHGAPTRRVENPDWEEGSDQPREIEVDNPDSKIPPDAVPISEEEHRTLLEGQAQGQIIAPDAAGHPRLEAPAPPSLEQLADHKRRAIDAARDAAFVEGLPYDIAGEPDVVQTRPQDQINLLGLSSKAQRLIADGVTDPVMPFRGQSNITRLLTPEQMDAMTLAALAHIEGIYQQSWERKDAIDAILEDAALSEDAQRHALAAVEWGA